MIPKRWKKMLAEYNKAKKSGMALSDFLQKNPEWSELCRNHAKLFSLLNQEHTSCKRYIFSFYALLFVFSLCLSMYFTRQYYAPEEPELPQLQIQIMHQNNDCFPILINFNKKMIQDEMIGQDATSFVKIPTLSIYAYWKTTDSICVTPTNKVPKATRFVLTLSSELKALDGTCIAQTKPFIFSSKPLTLEKFQQVSFNDTGVYFHIVFDDLVSREALLDKMDIVANEETPTFFLYAIEDHTKIYRDNPHCLNCLNEENVSSKMWELFIPRDQFQKKLVIKINEGLCGSQGLLGLQKTWESTYNFPELNIDNNIDNISYFHLDDVKQIIPSSGDCTAIFIFNDELNLQSCKQNMEIIPPVTTKMSVSGNMLYCKGGFQPSSQYAIRFFKNLKSANNWTINNETMRYISFESREPSFRIANVGDILSVHGSSNLTLESMNLNNVGVKIFRIYAENLHQILKDGIGRYSADSYYGQLLLSQIFPLNFKQNELSKTNFSLKKFLGEKYLPGMYYIYFYNTIKDEYYYYHKLSDKLISCSDLGITTLYSNKNACTIWCTSLHNGQPLENVDISVYTNKNHCVLKGKTDKQGLVHLTSKEPLPKNEQYNIVYATKENDCNFIELENNTWDLVLFDTAGATTTQDDYKVFMTTERGAYRPGETLHLHSIIRDEKRLLCETMPLDIAIFRSDNVEVYREKCNFQNGELEFAWNIPAEIRTGFYRAEVVLSGTNNKLQQYEFQIEEFVPDRYTVKVSCNQKEYNLSNEVVVSINATYLNGTPVAGNKVKITADITSLPISYKAYKNYTFGINNKTQSSMIKDEITLDHNGHGQLSFVLPETMPMTTWGNLNIVATLIAGGYTTTRTCSSKVYPRNTNIGVRLANGTVIEKNTPLDFQVITVDNAGQKTEPQTLHACFMHNEWGYYYERRSDGKHSYRYTQKEIIVEEYDVTTTQGVNPATLTFIPTEYGEYNLYLTDNTGAKTCFSFETWGGNEIAKNENEFLKLSLDQKMYHVGNNAKLHINAPYDGVALACLVRDKVIETYIVNVENKQADIEFAIKEEYIPNIYCMVSLVRPVTIEKGLHRIYGLLPLNIATDRELKLSLQHETTVQPEQETTVNITVTDFQEKAVENATVTVVAVDEGICQLTNFKSPNPYQYFYGKEALQMQIADLYSNIIPETMPGDTMNMNLTPLKSTAPLQAIANSVVLWNSNIQTDEQGQAKIKLNIPDYNGKLRIMAWSAKNNCFGAKDSFMTVTSPAPLLLNLPRFAVWEDQFALQATIQNHTGHDAPLKLTVSFDNVCIKSSENDVEIEKNSIEISETVLNETEYLVNIPVVVKVGCDLATIHFIGTLGEEKIDKTATLRLRPMFSMMHFTQLGTGTIGVPEKIKAKTSLRPETSTYKLTVSANPNLNLAKYMDELIQYPYGCVEQTTSKAFPLLYYADLLSIAENQDNNVSMTQAKQAVARNYIMEAIQRLQLMQLNNGGLSMWTQGKSVYPWGTVYAAHFLVEAKKIGYPIPNAFYDSILNWLYNNMQQNSNQNDQTAQEVIAYSAYVLAQADRLEYNDISYLMNKQHNSEIEAYYLMGAANKLGYNQKIDSLTYGQQQDNDVAMSENLHSVVRDSALSLFILLDIVPDLFNAQTEKEQQIIDYIHKLAQRLSKNINKSNTQENAFVILALGKYANYMQENIKNPFKGNVSYQNKIVCEFNNDIIGISSGNYDNTEFTIHTESSTQNTNTINDSNNIANNGSYFYYLQTSGVPASISCDSEQNGIKVTRRLLNENFESLENQKIHCGDLIWVEVDIQSDSNYLNIMLEQLLPTGFALENPRLANTVQMPKIKDSNLLIPEYTDIRDDRLFTFFHIKQRKYHYYFGIRAILPGDYYFPHTTIQCMYDANVNGRSEAIILDVEPFQPEPRG